MAWHQCENCNRLVTFHNYDWFNCVLCNLQQRCIVKWGEAKNVSSLQWQNVHKLTDMSLPGFESCRYFQSSGIEMKSKRFFEGIRVPTGRALSVAVILNTAHVTLRPHRPQIAPFNSQLWLRPVNAALPWYLTPFIFLYWGGIWPHKWHGFCWGGTDWKRTFAHVSVGPWKPPDLGRAATGTEYRERWLPLV